ncbi:MAG: winged helix-turn-helix domain-containing protein [Candidatus Hodarchaeales archaeon]|jgi:predicted transcriptional regulator
MTDHDSVPELKSSKIAELKTIHDPAVVPVLFHRKKQQILLLLIETDHTIMELKKKTKINPGTIKRHLNDLVEKNLVFQSYTIKNEYGFTLKYYRAVAKKFHVVLDFPPNETPTR